MIRCVISDLGKVLIFFDNQIFFKKMEDYCPFSKEKIVELTSAHFDLIEAFNKGETTPKEFYNQVVEKLEAKIEYDRFCTIYNDVFSLNPPVLQVMKRLKRNYKLILLSNTDVLRFGFLKEKFPEIMIFDEYILSFEVGLMKPHPEIYQKALKMSGVEADECVFIDDIEKNVEAALNIGINSILFKPGTDLETILREIGLSF